MRGFLAAQALEDGITFEPTFVGSKNPVEQRDQLRALADRHFDVIFYSPVTYEFSWDLNAYFKVGQWMTSRRRVDQTVSTAMDEVEKTLEVLATGFDAPTYIHNTANLRRHDSTPAEVAKVWLTRRVRRMAREGVNARLAERIAAWRAADANLILFDETAILARYGDVALGRYVYPTKIQHPAEMGRQVADSYRDILATHADLAGKKVVVCDLDNTLWKGEIGEGTVEHFASIQGVLLALRQKGVLLAVNSKNDPRNVRWDGALLSEDDFVNMQINWDSKVANMRRIQQALNLKLKDFVFIDDRADQRELIREALPEVCVLDATSPRLAGRLAHWAAALPDNPETDRTRQYRQREQRESFLSESVAPAEDPASAFARLEIRAEVRDARPAELKRVAELINRTNQFNLAGSRTSLNELRKWHAGPGGGSSSPTPATSSARWGWSAPCCSSSMARQSEYRPSCSVAACSATGSRTPCSTRSSGWRGPAPGVLRRPSAARTSRRRITRRAGTCTRETDLPATANPGSSSTSTRRATRAG